jgi:type VI secretion system protein ImpJ
MSLDSKVIWSEGMFLNPQHFQQQERYFERLVAGRCSAFGSYGWGLHEFEIDQQLLNLGKVSLIKGSGIFPDGTPFNFPDMDEPPPVFEVPENIHNCVLHLCVPVKRPGAVDVLSEHDAQGMARYYSMEQQTRDVSNESGDNVTVNVGKLRLRLMLETDDLSGYSSIGLIRIAESREDKNVLLDDAYIATCLSCNKTPKLSGYISELIGLLHHRGEAIAGRLADTSRGGTAEISDYMMLQLINRVEPIAKHMASVNGLHPIDLFAESLKMVGEFSTFVAKTRRTPEFPNYLHHDLQATFTPVMTALRSCLSMVYEQTAVSLNLVEKKYGIKVAEITDRSLIGSAMFVLAARADVREDALRSHLPAQTKIGPVERIRQLVNAAMPGIGLIPLPVAPRQIPYRSGYTYFQLDSKSDFWNELKNSGGFALHVGGDFPGLELEFWAIRQ